MVEEFEISRQIAKVLSPSNITSQQNNYSPAGINDADYLRVTGDTSQRIITGLSKKSAGDMTAADGGAEITLVNVGANTLLLAEDGATPALSSNAANRFRFGRDIPLFPNRSVDLVYDGTLLRWIPKVDLGMVYVPTRLGYSYNMHGFRNASDSVVQQTPATGGQILETGQTSVQDRPGTLTFTSGTSATGFAAIVTGGLNSILLGNSWYWRYEMYLRTLVLSSAGLAYTLRIGFIDANNAESTDGCFFRYTHSVNSGKFQCVTRSNNVETGSAIDSGFAAEINNYNRFEIRVYPSGSLVDFLINGSLVGSNTTNIPTGAGRGVGSGIMFLKSAGISDTNLMVQDTMELVAYANKVV